MKTVFFPRVNCLFLTLWASFLLLPQHSQASPKKIHGETGALLWVAQGSNLVTHFLPRRPLRLKSKKFVRLGMRWDGPSTLEWEVRFKPAGRPWTSWQSVQTTFSIRELHNSHADPPDGFAHWVEIRIRNEASPSFVALELIEKLGPCSPSSLPPPPIQQAPLSPRSPLGVTGPFNPRKAWGAKAARCSTANPTKTRIAIHHTAGSNSSKYTPEETLRSIQRYHQVTQQWCDIGYHILISQDGRAWEGRPAGVLGSHVGGQNKNTLGISFMGTFTSLTPNSKMLCTAAKIIDWASKLYGIPRNRKTIMGHREFPNQSTACPGNKLLAEIGNIITMSKQTGQCTTPPPPKCDAVKPTRLGGGRLNIRKEATASSAKLGDVAEGTCLKVLAKETNGQNVKGDKTWYKISHNGVTGWISGYYADCSNCNPATSNETASEPEPEPPTDNGAQTESSQPDTRTSTDAGSVDTGSAPEGNTEQQTANESTVEAGSPIQDRFSQADQPDDKPFVLDSGVGKPCQRTQDCLSTEACIQGVCRNINGNLPLKLGGGCGCNNTQGHRIPAFLLFLLALLLFWRGHLSQSNTK